MEELPERPQKVLELRYLAGLSNSEIAGALDISVRSVERDLNQGRGLLRVRLGGLSSLAIIGAGRGRAISAPPELFDDLLRVVRMGGALGSSTALTVISGAILMKKTLVASGLAFLIVFLGWWKFTGNDEPVQLEPSFVEMDSTESRSEPPPAELVEVVPERVETEPPAGDAETREVPEPGRMFVVACEDADGDPVAGAEVYLVEVASRGHGKTIGPVESDDDGLARFEGIPSDAEPWLLRSYARLPGGDLAGFGELRVPREALVDDEDEVPGVVVLVETAALEGVVIVPDGTDLSGVTVNVEGLYFHHPESLSPMGESFAAGGDSGEQLWPRLFSRTPDANGRFVFGELPARARVRLVARGPGVARGRTRLDQQKGGPDRSGHRQQGLGRASLEPSERAGWRKNARPSFHPPACGRQSHPRR